MKTLLMVCILSICSLAPSAASVHSLIQEVDQLLKKEVKNGQVDYQHIKQNFQVIDKLYQQIGSADLNGLSDAEKKAFYLNAYNIIVIHEVAKYYPLKSPMDKSGFFDKVRHVVAGENLSLNALEIKKIIQPYHDPRIHFALACAAKSCPPLASFAYDPEKLDAQLDERAKLSLNNNNFIRVKGEEKKVLVSKIFDWYKKDFTQDGQTVLDFINQYRDNPINDSYSVDCYEYNWQLNNQN